MNTNTNLQAQAKLVGVIDTGAGNLFSIFACLKRLGHKAVLLKEPQDNIDLILIPGQGRFSAVMKRLQQSGMDHFISKWFLDNKPIIGICVGMQIFFQSSEEDREAVGLALLGGHIEKLDSPKQPMVGWCQLTSSEPDLQEKVVYFVNSYALKGSRYAIATVEYGEQFVAAIKAGSLIAFQFHPEKSGPAGEELLSSCLV